jgi:hypothetical protein
MNTSSLIQKVWNFCHTLRDDGAGQYFTPRPLIQAMVECVRPEPLRTIADPACGTGGFFLGAYAWLTRPGQTLDRRQKEFLRRKTFSGNEIVPSARRLCLMNLFLHNIGDLDDEPTVDRTDALIADAGERFDYVLANPPFGKKSSMTITNAEGEEDRDALTYERQDFWETTDDLRDFITSYHPENRFDRTATERFKYYPYADLIARDKASLDLFWLKDDALDSLDDLPSPQVLQQEIIDHLEAALTAFRDVAAGLAP